MKKKHIKQEYIKRKSLEGGVQFDPSGENNKEDGFMKIYNFHKSRSH